MTGCLGEGLGGRHRGLGLLVGHRLEVEHQERDELVDDGLREEHAEVEDVVVVRRHHLKKRDMQG